MTDELARQAANMHFFGSEPFFGVSKHQHKMELKDWEAKEMASFWRKTAGEEIHQLLAK